MRHARSHPESTAICYVIVRRRRRHEPYRQIAVVVIVLRYASQELLSCGTRAAITTSGYGYLAVGYYRTTRESSRLMEAAAPPSPSFPQLGLKAHNLTSSVDNGERVYSRSTDRREALDVTSHLWVRT